MDAVEGELSVATRVGQAVFGAPATAASATFAVGKGRAGRFEVRFANVDVGLGQRICRLLRDAGPRN